MERRSTRRSTFSATLLLTGGTAAAQAINLAVSPAITRLYGPADLGLFGLYFAFLSVALGVVTLRYELGIVSAPTDDDAWALVRLCAVLILPLAAFGAIVLAAAVALDVAGFGGLPWPSVIVAFAGLFLSGALIVLRFVAVRADAFSAVSQATLRQAIVRAVGQLALGITGAGVVGLMIGDATARLAGSRTLLRAAPGVTQRVRVVTMDRVWTAARRYWRFPIISVPSTLLDTLSTALIVPLVAAIFGVAAAGQLFLVQRVLALPLAVLGTSVADIFHKRLADEVLAQSRQERKVVLRTSGALLIMGLPIAGLVMLSGDTLFEGVFGSDWRPAGQVAAIVAPWTLTQLVVSPVSRAVYVMQGQVAKLAFDVTSVGVSVGTLWYAAASGLGFLEALRLLAGLAIAANVFYFVLILRMTTPRGD